MSDSAGGGIGSMIAEAAQAVVEPVKDEIGQAIETGVQAVVGTTPAAQDPAADAKKAAEEQKKAEFKWIIEKNKRLETDLAAVRQKKAADAQKTEQANQQQEEVKQYKAVEKNQKRDAMARQVQEAKTRSETRKGVGG